MSQMVVDLLSAKENVDVALECPAAQKPQQILASPPRLKNSKVHWLIYLDLLIFLLYDTHSIACFISVLLCLCVHVHQGKHKKTQGAPKNGSARGSCQGELSVQEANAHHFSGSAHSHMRFDSVPPGFSKTCVLMLYFNCHSIFFFTFSPLCFDKLIHNRMLLFWLFRPNVAMAVRVNSSNGLIFYAAAETGRVALTLSVSEGHLILLLNGGKRKFSIMTSAKYNDNHWHMVSVWDKKWVCVTLKHVGSDIILSLSWSHYRCCFFN